MESYVSSLAIGNKDVSNNRPTTTRSIQQSKINAALKGINEALDTYEEDETKQPYGIAIYSGPITNVTFPNIKPKNAIPIIGTTADGNSIWVGTVSTNGYFSKIEQSLVKCEHVDYYEKTSGSGSPRRHCTRYGGETGYPNPYFPDTRENRFNRCNFKTARQVAGITCIQEGYCECYVVDYPGDADVDYYCRCTDFLCQIYNYETCQYDCYWYTVYYYYTYSTWIDCHVEYCYRNYDSCTDYSKAQIQVYQKYKTT